MINIKKLNVDKHNCLLCNKYIPNYIPKYIPIIFLKNI